MYRLAGRLDSFQMTKLRLRDVIEKLGSRHCIMDLAELAFVDGSGLFFFLKIQKALAQRGKRVVLCTANTNVLQILNMSKLIHLFEVVPDLTTAQQRLK